MAASTALTYVNMPSFGRQNRRTTRPYARATGCFFMTVHGSWDTVIIIDARTWEECTLIYYAA